MVTELHVEGVDHRRNVLGGHYHIGEVEGIAMAAVAGDMAVLASGVGNVELVANQREVAGDMHRVRFGRRLEQQGVLLAGSTVILEDPDALDAGLAFTSTADPPHVLLSQTDRKSTRMTRREQTQAGVLRKTASRPTTRLLFMVRARR